MVETSAVVSLREALGAAINAGSNPPTAPGGEIILLSQRVFRGTAQDTEEMKDRRRQNLAWGYFLLGQPDEGNAGYYGALGHDGSQRVHPWADTEDNALRLFGWFKGLVDGVVLTVSGHLLVTGSVALVTTQPDSDGKAWQAVTNYTAETVQS